MAERTGPKPPPRRTQPRAPEPQPEPRQVAAPRSHVRIVGPLYPPGPRTC